MVPLHRSKHVLAFTRTICVKVQVLNSSSIIASTFVLLYKIDISRVYFYSWLNIFVILSCWWTFWCTSQNIFSWKTYITPSVRFCACESFEFQNSRLFHEKHSNSEWKKKKKITDEKVKKLWIKNFKL